jgi:L-rhamnonate dehydratase
MMTRVNAPFAEFLMMSPTGSEIVPMFSPLFVEEPVPENGRMRLSERPGFGVELDKTLAFERPFTH